MIFIFESLTSNLITLINKIHLKKNSQKAFINVNCRILLSTFCVYIALLFQVSLYQFVHTINGHETYPTIVPLLLCHSFSMLNEVSQTLTTLQV